LGSGSVALCILNVGTDEGEWSVSLPGKEPLVPTGGCAGLRASLNTTAKRKGIPLLLLLGIKPWLSSQ